MNRRIFTIVIIVAIFTVVVVLFNNQNVKSDVDSVHQELIYAANTSQSLWARPQMMGGAGRDFTNLDEKQILQEAFRRTDGFEAHNDYISNDTGIYMVEIISATEIILKGVTKNQQHEVKMRVKRNNETEEWEIESCSNQ